MQIPRLNRRDSLTLVSKAGCWLLVPFSGTKSFAQDNKKKDFMKAAIKWIAEDENRLERARKHDNEKGIYYDIAATPNVKPFVDWDYFYIDNDLIWRPSENENFAFVKVPKGFVTDLASVPQPLWSIFPRTGRYAYAAIVHDYLYWVQDRTREEANLIFKFAMKDLKVANSTLNILYEAVDHFGAFAWEQNIKLKAAGEKRMLKVFPEDLTISWEEWRKRPGVLGDLPPPEAPVHTKN